MRISLTATGVVIVLMSCWTVPVSAAANQDEAQRNSSEPAVSSPQHDPPADTTSTNSQSINADELGVSIDRIRLKFTRSSVFTNVFDPDKLKITAYVDVVAPAPEIKLFGSDPKTVKEQLTSRAVPFGPPTHQDVVQMVTPPNFRMMGMDISALIDWLTQQLQKKEEK